MAPGEHEAPKSHAERQHAHLALSIQQAQCSWPWIARNNVWIAGTISCTVPLTPPLQFPGAGNTNSPGHKAPPALTGRAREHFCCAPARMGKLIASMQAAFGKPFLITLV